MSHQQQAKTTATNVNAFDHEFWDENDDFDFEGDKPGNLASNQPNTQNRSSAQQPSTTQNHNASKGVQQSKFPLAPPTANEDANMQDSTSLAPHSGIYFDPPQKLGKSNEGGESYHTDKKNGDVVGDASFASNGQGTTATEKQVSTDASKKDARDYRSPKKEDDPVMNDKGFSSHDKADGSTSQLHAPSKGYQRDYKNYSRNNGGSPQQNPHGGDAYEYRQRRNLRNPDDQYQSSTSQREYHQHRSYKDMQGERDKYGARGDGYHYQGYHSNYGGSSGRPAAGSFNEQQSRRYQSYQQDQQIQDSASSLPLSEIKVHFTLIISQNFKDSVFRDESGKREFIDVLTEDFRRVKGFNKERMNIRDIFTLDFDQEKSEVKLAFKYDHHAYAIADGDINRLRLPREVSEIQIGKVFKTYMAVNAEELKALINPSSISQQEPPGQKHRKSSRSKSSSKTRKPQEQQSYSTKPGQPLRERKEETPVADSDAQRDKYGRDAISTKERRGEDYYKRGNPDQSPRKSRSRDRTEDKGHRKTSIPQEDIQAKGQTIESAPKEEKKKGNNFDVTPEQQKAKDSLQQNSVGSPQQTDLPFNCFYLCAIPFDLKGPSIKEELVQCNIPEPSNWEMINKNDNCGFICKYLKFIYTDQNEKEIKDKITKVLENASSCKMKSQNILVLPALPDVPVEQLVAHHQVVFRFPNQESNLEYQDAVNFCKAAIAEDVTYLRRETTALYKFFQEEIGPVVDMNLDSFPEYIVVTFVNHKDVVKALEKESEFQFQLQSSKDTKLWKLKAGKIDFTCHVRNCPRGDESAPNKYLPVYVQNERLAKAKEALLGNQATVSASTSQVQPSLQQAASAHSSGENNHRTVSLSGNLQ